MTSCFSSTRMDAREETLNLLNKLWAKLQNLPNATAVELGAFFILLSFICESLLQILVKSVKPSVVVMS